MKFKLLSLLGCLLLMTALLTLSASAAYTLPEVNKKDTVSRGNLIDVETEARIPFQYEIPENGVAVLYFYKTTCGLSQYTFSSLNGCDWVHDPRVRFYAIESTAENGCEEIRGFQKEQAPNITDVFTWLDSASNHLCSRYLYAAGLDGSGWTWPVVMVITEENGVNTIRAASDGATDVRLLGNTLELLLKADLGVPKPVPVTISVEEDYDMAARAVELINARREENGLAPLQYNKALTQAAMVRAAEAALYPSDTRPDGTASYEVVKPFMPNSTVTISTPGFYCDSPEDFWAQYISPINYERWIYTEYEESGLTQIGAGCVSYNNTRFWALTAASDDSSANAPADQSGQTVKRHIINIYTNCLDDPDVYPQALTLYPQATATVQLYGNADYMSTPLIAASCTEEIKDAGGQVIATAAIQADGSVLVTAAAVGTGELQVRAWDGQAEPYTTSITVSDAPQYKPHTIHTTVTGLGSVQLQREQAQKGDTVSFTVTPDAGQWLCSLNAEDARGNHLYCYSTEENEYLLQMPAEDVYLTAVFLSDDIPQIRYSITEDITGHGSLSYHRGSASAYATTYVTVTAEGSMGQTLKSLTVSDADGTLVEVSANTDGSYTFQMPASAVTVCAVFGPEEGYGVKILDTYCCTVTASPATADPNDTVTVTITPDEGYTLRDYSINLSESSLTWVDDYTLTFPMPMHDVELAVYCKPSAVTQGPFGDGLTWAYADGTLTISGAGSMGSFDSTWDIPWDDYRDNIQTAVIKEGVTDITEYAFSYMDSLTAVTIPASVEYIDGWAFLNAEALTHITFAGSAPTRGIDSAAFSGVTAQVSVPVDDRSWTESVTLNYGGTLTWSHSWSTAVTEPTCTQGGYTQYTCSCGDTENADETAPLGHSYANGRCTRCGESDPDFTEPMENPFIDVAEADWFYAPVLWAVEHQVTGGTSPNTFSPDALCTRGQVVTFLWAANGKPEPVTTENIFTDVSENDYFYQAVLWAVENGITGGTSPNTFSPHAPCTRAHVVTFLWAADLKPIMAAEESPFRDVSEDAYYCNAVLWAASNHITGGIGDGLFGPDQGCTRSQIVTFLYKAAQK